MFKAIILLKRRDDMTSAEFENWWFSEHAPLAAGLAGVRKIVFNKAEDGGAFDGVSELWFDSEDALTSALSSPEGKVLLADLPNFAKDVSPIVAVEHPMLWP